MRNFIKFSAVACVCVGLAVADGGFIGVEGGYSFGSKLSTSGGSVKDGAPNIGIKGGYDWGDLRNYIQYNHHFKAKKSGQDDGIKEKDKWSTNEIIAGLDWTPSVADGAKFVLGAYTGVSWLDIKADLESADGRKEQIKDNLKGWLLGTKLGAIVSLNDNTEVEGGLKVDKTFGYHSNGVLSDIKQLKYGAYMGVNFKF